MSLQAEEDSTDQALSENSNSLHEFIDETENLDEIPEELVLDGTEMDIDESDFVAESQDLEEEEEEVIDLAEDEEEFEPPEVEIQSDDQAEEVVEKIPLKRIKPATSVPPLRLLNIAPKPEVPFSVKSTSGQQLILLPGGSGAQTIKLINPQGQELNLANYSVSRPLTVNKQSGKITTMAPQQAQTKQLIMKKIITTTAPQNQTVSFTKQGQQFMLVQKNHQPQQNFKIVQSGGNNTTQKTITLQQAQEMGLLSNNTKLLQSPTGINKQTVLINKPQSKTIKLVPQINQTISLGQMIKPQGKIIRAAPSAPKRTQRVILKSSGTNQVLPAGQLIQVAGTQGLANGQIHQINVPGKGVQYVKFVTASSAQSTNSTVTLVNSVKSTTSAPEVKPVLTTMATTKLIAKPSTSAAKQVVLVPAGFLPANVTQQVHKVAIPAMTQKRQPIAPHPKKMDVDTPSPTKANASSNPEPLKTSPTIPTTTTSSQTNTDTTAESQNNALRPRKPCNCTKSQCLKLYCDCFANGEFCYLCNCVNCFNNLENEETRNLAIRACLERNPIAFRPKIGKAKESGDVVLRKHTKGCNCKRSGCLKNYCECYEAKIACSSNCRCVGCRNIEDGMDKRKYDSSPGKSVKLSTLSDAELADTVYRKITPHKDGDLSLPSRPRKTGSRKQTVTFMTEEVVEATCQCILTISDEAESSMQEEELTMKQIIEEFGGCLSEIIHCSLNRNNVT